RLSVMGAATAFLVSLAVLTLPSAATLRAQTKADTPPAPSWARTANLLELMRAVYFPASNMIFNVQTFDPAQKKAVPPSSGGPGFDWVQWGTNLYEGWEYVDYAAALLAESSPLLLTPGRLCANGKPVPVDRTDWIKFTNDMLAAARKSYTLS